MVSTAQRWKVLGGDCHSVIEAEKLRATSSQWSWTNIAMPAADAKPAMGRGTTFAPPASARQPPGERAVSVLWSFGKCLGALLPVYLAGYYGFSISVVLFGLMIYMGWKHSRLDKMMRLKSAMYLLENEREFTTENVFRAKRDLPPWVRTRYMVMLCSLYHLPHLSGWTATLHHCYRLFHAYSSLVGTWYLFRSSILLKNDHNYA